MKFLSSLRKLYIQYQNWLGATPVKSPLLDEGDGKFIKQYLSAKDDKEAEAILEKHFDKILEDIPTEFSEDKVVAEEDLPHWLRENPEASLSKSLSELNINGDEWISEDNRISAPIHPLLIFCIGVVAFSTIGLLGIGFFGDKVLWISFMIFIPILIIGVIAGYVAYIRDRKAINQTWQEFAENYGLDYEINKDTRRLFGEYHDYIVSVSTNNVGVRGVELKTYISLLSLRVSQDTYIKLSPYGILDKFRRLGEQKKSVKGEFEQHFKIITQPKHLAYVILSSTKLCERLLKIESYQAKIEVVDKVLYFQESTPPKKTENWQFLLNTLCMLARTIERADK